jgi:hypothetical protein
MTKVTGLFESDPVGGMEKGMSPILESPVTERWTTRPVAGFYGFSESTLPFFQM